MKLGNRVKDIRHSVKDIRHRLKTPDRNTIQTALKVTAGAGAAIWVALKFKRELYGPGGTRMARYDTSVDKVWDKNDDRRRRDDR